MGEYGKERRHDITEIWNTIDATNGKYEVSNFGNVRNTSTGKNLSPRPTPTGYLRIHIFCDGKRKDLYIHRLVAEAFCQHKEGCNVINHIDNNPRNNNYLNLEWTTQRGNVLHAMEQGRVPRFPNAKHVIAIKNGITAEYRTSHEASEITGCNHSAIIKCCKGKCKTTHGYSFRYAEAAT